MKVARHQAMIDKGSMITSIDEEGGLIEYGYDRSAKVRYSRKLLDNLRQYLAGVQKM